MQNEYYYEQYMKDKAYIESEKIYKQRKFIKNIQKVENVSKKTIVKSKKISTAGISDQILGVSEKLRYNDI